MVTIIQSIVEVHFYFRCSEKRTCHEISRRVQVICVIYSPYTVRQQKNKPVQSCNTRFSGSAMEDEKKTSAFYLGN
jgi:hypothetical protein